MSAISLRLERRDVPQRETVAWFLASTTAGDWMEALSHWTAGAGELRLFLVPRSGSDSRAAGLLVIPPPGQKPPAEWRALALGSIENRLFFPVDAEVFPPATSAEVRALCPSNLVLFHPGLGLFEFTESDRKHLWELLEPPSLIPANWNAARGDTPLNSRLLGVSLVALPEHDDVFGDAEKEIGSEPPTKLPRRRKEPSANPIGQLGRAVAGLGAGALVKMLSWFSSPPKQPSQPGKAPARNWVNDVMDWASAKLASVSRELEELRHRELHRLMEMLNSDPERGLRHALPLSGEPGRGRVAPGGRLGPRDIRYRTGGSGGGPADPWDIPWELRQKLTARYRELAQQERQHGRFRRAAYIYAELLGDWTAAAAVLKEGLHFTEAAILFRDKLGQPVAAAECFAAAGLFREAIAIYEKEKLFLELGDLHRKLDDQPAAAAAYWRVVEQKTSAGDLLGAAALLEGRLRLPDKALTLLGKAWPGSPQAAQCLTEQFSLLGRLGRHEHARERVLELRDEQTPPRQVILLAEVLARLRETYPDGLLRPLVADVARVKISSRLAAGDASEARAGTRLLSELAPEDRLLARDASRFLVDRLEVLARRTPTPPPPPPRKPGSKRVGVPRPRRNFSLVGVKEILKVSRLGSHFLAAVVTKASKTEILRGNWGEESPDNPAQVERSQQSVAWANENLRHEQISLIQSAKGGLGPVFVVTAPTLLRKEFVLPASDRFLQPLPLSAPPWLPDGVATMAVSAGHSWILRHSNGEWIVDIRTANGYLSGEFSLQSILDEIPEPVTTVAMLAVRSEVWIALGRSLFKFEQPRRPSKRWICETPIIALEPTFPLLATGVVARCERGAAVFWCDYLKDVEMVASDLVAPFATSLGNGMIAFLASQAGPDGFAGRVIDMDRHGVHSEADFQWEGGRPAGLVALPQPNAFAVFEEKGAVQVYEVPTVG